MGYILVLDYNYWSIIGQHANKAVNPTDYIPIHGEVLFLRRNCDFATKEFPEIKNHFIRNFSSIVIDKNFDGKLLIKFRKICCHMTNY